MSCFWTDFVGCSEECPSVPFGGFIKAGVGGFRYDYFQSTSGESKISLASNSILVASEYPPVDFDPSYIRSNASQYFDLVITNIRITAYLSSEVLQTSDANLFRPDFIPDGLAPNLDEQVGSSGQYFYTGINQYNGPSSQGSAQLVAQQTANGLNFMVPKSVGSNSYSMDAATFFAGVGLSDMVQYVTNNSYVCLIELSAEFGEVMVYAFGKTPLMYFVD